MTNSKSLFVVAGEPSGDTHAAHVVRDLLRIDQTLCIRGFGGPKMAEAGVEILADLASQAIMGLFPVVKALPRIRGWFRLAEEELRTRRPSVLLLVDYPGFNLRLAKIAKRLDIPVIYYISPQIWAWHQSRVKRIRELVDLMIVILPFEEEFYRQHGVEVYYAGHPLADRLASDRADPKVVEELKSRANGQIVGLFPGSRAHVIRALAPDFIRAAKDLTTHPDLRSTKFLIAAIDEEHARWLKEQVQANSLKADVITDASFEIMAAADVALTTSGTTTLELAGHKTPMVLAYKVSPVVLAIGKLAIRVPYIGLVNLVAQKEIAAEHISSSAMWPKLSLDLQDLLLNRELHRRAQENLAMVTERLDSLGSYQRTAMRIAAFMD